VERQKERYGQTEEYGQSLRRRSRTVTEKYKPEEHPHADIPKFKPDRGIIERDRRRREQEMEPSNGSILQMFVQGRYNTLVHPDDDARWEQAGIPSPWKDPEGYTKAVRNNVRTTGTMTKEQAKKLEKEMHTKRHRDRVEESHQYYSKLERPWYIENGAAIIFVAWLVLMGAAALWIIIQEMLMM
jgi:hypothetical protein